MTTEIVDPQSLRLHPFLEKVPGDGEYDPELIMSMTCDIESRGLEQPIVVDEKNRVMDGRLRLKIALSLELPEIEIVRRRSDDAATIIVQSLLQRRHYSKSALAYLAYPFFEQMAIEARTRRLRILQSGGKTEHSAQNALCSTAEEIARAASVSRRLFFQAAEVHKLFKKHPHAKKQFEPQILSGDLCLGYAINGIAGLVSTAGTSRRDATQLELFERVFHAASVRFSSRWQNLSNRDQQKVIAQYVTEFLPSLPPELHQAYRRFLKSEKLEAGR